MSFTMSLPYWWVGSVAWGPYEGYYGNGSSADRGGVGTAEILLRHCQGEAINVVVYADCVFRRDEDPDGFLHFGLSDPDPDPTFNNGYIK